MKLNENDSSAQRVALEFETAFAELAPTLSPALAEYLHNLTAQVFNMKGKITRLESKPKPKPSQEGLMNDERV